jgi:hypothetical protein
MEGIGSAASVIAVIQLAGSIIEICGGYVAAVKNANKEIDSLRKVIEELKDVLQTLSRLLDGPNGPKLFTSQKLALQISDCSSELTTLKERLRSGPKERVIGRLRLRSLKWPLQRKEVTSVMNNLERHKQSFVLALQVDQT